jgi:hypothetical protein
MQHVSALKDHSQALKYAISNIRNMYTDVFKFVMSQISNHPYYEFENICIHNYYYRMFQIAYFNA